MSESDGGPGRREVAYRLFAAEYDHADLSYSEGDEERAPNYVVTPSGARVNRLFVVGVLTEVENVSDDYLRARIVDPTGPFVVYAGQYQPEAMRFLETANPPTFVAVTGKARTFQPDDSDRVYTSIRPESINEVDAGTRDRWVIQAAEATLSRVARAAEAKSSGLTGDDLEASLVAADVEEGLANGIPIALEHYETSGEYLAALRDLSLDALRVVAGERDEVETALPAPDAGGDDPLADLAKRTLEAVAAESTAAAEAPEADTDATETVTDEPEATADQMDASESTDVTEASTESAEETASDTEASAETPVATAGDAGTATEEPAAADVGADERTDEETAGAAAADDTVETPAETESSTDESEDETAADPASDIGDFEGEFELDEDEREEIESEYGTEFKSGTEVEEPGEADIETADPDEEGAETEAAATTDAGAESGATADADEVTGETVEDTVEEPESPPTDETGVESADESEPEPADEAESETAAETEPEPADETEPETADDEEAAADVALDDAVMDAMTDLDDGDGADRDAVVAEVVDATGADPGDVEDAIQDALMDGRCYEPNDGTLKPI